MPYRLLVVCCLVSVLGACRSEVPVVWRADAPPAPQEACTTAFDARCETLLLEARIAKDWVTAGQLALGASLAASAPDKKDLLVRLALHWNPSPWLPEAQRAGMPQAQEPITFAASDVLLIGDVSAEGIEGADTANRLALAWPAAGERRLGASDDVASLASMWAQGAGAVIAVIPGDGPNDAMAVPVAPHLERLLGMPIEGIPVSRLEAARAVAAADQQLSAGDANAALATLGTALDALANEGASCRTKGLLHYARWRLAVAIGDETTPHLNSLNAACIQASVSASEDAVKGYLAALVLLQDYHIITKYPAYRPVVWQTPEGFGAQASALKTLRPKLGPRPMAVLDALWLSVERHTAHGNNTCGRHQPLEASSLDEPRDALVSLGREDLAQALYDEQLEQYQTASFDRVDAWMRQAQRWPWLSGYLLGSGLVSLGRRAWLVPMPQATSAVCVANLEAQLRLLDADTNPGFEQRAGYQWVRSAYWLQLCGPEVVSKLWSRSLLHSQKHSKEHLFGVLSEIFSALNGYQVVVTQLSAVPGMAHGLSLAAKQAIAAQTSDRSTDALTERVTLALIDIWAQQIRQWLGGAPSEFALDAAMKGALSTLDGLAGTQGSTRYAPFVRLLSLTAWATAAALSQTPGSADAVALLEQTLKADLLPVLAPFGAQAHEPALRETALVLVEVLRAASDPAALKALAPRLAALPGVVASDQLGLLLEVAQVALFETHGALLFRANDAKGAQASWDEAAARLPALAERLVQTFGLEDSGFTPFLTLLPVAHHMAIAGITASEDQDLFAAILNDANRAQFRQALDQTEQQLLAAKHQEAPMMLAVVRILRDAVAVPDFLAAFDDGKKLGPIAAVFVRHAEGLSPSLRAALFTFAGMMHHPSDPDAARKLWQQTREVLASTPGADFDPRLLTLIELSLADNNPDADPLKSLTLLDALLGSADTCPQADQITYAALLPWRATLLGHLGRTDEAIATLDQYLALIGQGYSGASEIACHFESQSQAVVLSFDIKAVLGADLRPLSAKQASFNFGFQTHGRAREVISCVARPVEGYRFDILMEVALLRAAYALRGGDDQAAKYALQSALYEGFRLANATYNILGPSALSAGTAREQVNLTLLRQVAVLAMARGFIFEGIGLQDLATALTNASEKATEDEPGDNQLTLALRGLSDLQPVAELATLSAASAGYGVTASAPLPALTPAQLKAWQSIPGVQPWTQPLAAVLVYWNPRFNTHQALQALCAKNPPKLLCKPDPTNLLPHYIYRVLLDSTRPFSADPSKPTPSTLSLDEYQKLLDAFAFIPSPQALYRLSLSLVGLISQYPPDAIFTLMDRTLKALNPDHHPIEYALVLSSFLGLMGSPEAIDNYQDMLSFIATTLTDRIPPQSAFQYQLALFNLMGRLQRHDPMRGFSYTLFLTASRLPDGQGIALQLSIIDAMLRLRAGELPLAELDAWLAYWAPLLEAPVYKRLEAVRAALPADPTQARNLATQIINGFFQ